MQQFILRVVLLGALISFCASQHMLCDHAGNNFSPLRFLFGMCNVRDQIPEMTDQVLTMLNFNETRQVHDELVNWQPHLKNLLNGTFCADLVALDYKDWQEESPKDYPAEEFF